ncbi:MAG: protein translocase subunit SecD, partial [Desulfobacterales bacterium]
MKNISWRLVLVFAVLVAAIIYILPSFKPALWPHKQINLGLDLQGGMHLVLEVDTEKAVDSTTERISQEIREQLKNERIRHVSVNRIEGSRISVEVNKEESIDKLKALLDDEFRDLRELSKTETSGSYAVVMDIPDPDREQIKKLAVDQALETIRNRIDQFGV